MTYSIGIDSGSTATKGILLADGVITRRFLVPTPFRPATAITEAWETLREGLETTPFLTLTGYGRQLVDFADKQVTEISCHGLGARFLAPATRAVIDIGGQDSKVIQLDDDGNLCDFLMNDKCAAGTGRFLEVISRTLGTSVEQLDSITENVTPHAITSMCTVFAESEVISLRSAGVASAGMLIFGSTLIMQHTRHPFVLAALFSGVGIGIALGNEYVLAGLHFAFSSQTLWQGAGALSGMMLIALTLLMPSKKHAIAPMPLAKTEQQIMSWWLLAILYGLAGFGYIIVATYLPLMAKDAGSPLLTAHLWTLVGLSIVPGCFGWLWAAKRWGALPCLTANLLVQAISVLLTLASDSPLLLIISSIGFGGTFMGTTSLVMTIARQLSVPGNLNLLGFVTLIYGIGQILGPALTSMLGNGTSALAGATLCGAAALFIAALISTVQLFKLQVVTS